MLSVKILESLCVMNQRNKSLQRKSGTWSLWVSMRIWDKMDGCRLKIFVCCGCVYASGSECAINASLCCPMLIWNNRESECFLAGIWPVPSTALPSTLPGYDLAVKMLSITIIEKAVLFWHAPSGMALQTSLQAFCHSPRPVRCTCDIMPYKCHSYEGLWHNLQIFSQLESKKQSHGIEESRR